jgi:hypothetical protein
MNDFQCANDAQHEGPFYSVNAVAYLVGKGCYPKGKKRIVHRYHLGRFCKGCLEKQALGFPGRILFECEAFDRAGDC